MTENNTNETDQSPKPCGTYHPLPCGLDRACEVPVDYFDVELESGEIWSAYTSADE